MRRAILPLVCLCAIPIGAADLTAWFPLSVGHRWVYDSVSKNGDARNPTVSRWTASVTVLDQIPTPEGTIIVRAVALEGAPNPPGGWRWERVPLLLRGDCVYPLYPEAWNPQSRRFTPKFAEYIAQVSAMFCFPLEIGATWKTAGDWGWTVDGTGPVAQGPQDIPRDAFRLKSEPSGAVEYVWFVRGVGPVASWSWHNGTYTEGFEKLRQ